MSLTLCNRTVAAFAAATAIGCSPSPREPSSAKLAPKRESAVRASETSQARAQPILDAEELEAALLCFAGPYVGCWREDSVHALLRCANRASHLPGGARFEFQPFESLLPELALLVERERACCTTLAFSLHAQAERGPIVLEVTGGPILRQQLRSR